MEYNILELIEQRENLKRVICLMKQSDVLTNTIEFYNETIEIKQKELNFTTLKINQLCEALDLQSEYRRSDVLSELLHYLYCYKARNLEEAISVYEKKQK